MAVINPPELPAFIVNGSKDHKYVLTYSNKWVSELKQSRRVKGESVGRAIPVDGMEGCYELQFNADFVAKYPELEQFKVLRHKGGKLEFKPVDSERFTLEDRCKVQKLHGGATWALQQIITGTPFHKALKRTFPHQALDRKLLSLAYFLVMEQDSSLSHYEEFAERTYLPYQAPLTGSAISKILKSVSHDDIERFFKNLHEEYRKQDKEHKGLDGHNFYALDSTSISTSASISSAEYGHSKDGLPIPQINVLMIVDQKTGLPCYYRQISGSIPDVLTVRNTIADLTRIGVNANSVIMVSDRGYTSADNISDYLRNDFSFICNCKVNAEGFAHDYAMENYADLLNWDNGIAFLGQTCKTLRVNWRYERMPIEGKRNLYKDSDLVYVHIYYDEKINAEHTHTLKTNLLKYVELYNREPKKLSATEMQFIDLYTEQHDGRASICMSKVNKALKLKGVRVLISNVVSDPVEAYMAYENRNHVEYAFNTIKSRLKCNRARVHSYESFNSKLFLQMLASFIFTMIRHRVKNWNDVAKSNKNKYTVMYDSDCKLVAKLDNIMMTRFRDGWYFDEITKKKAELFKIIGVPVPTTAQEGTLDDIIYDNDPSTEDPVNDDPLAPIQGNESEVL